VTATDKSTVVCASNCLLHFLPASVFKYLQFNQSYIISPVKAGSPKSISNWVNYKTNLVA